MSRVELVAPHEIGILRELPLKLAFGINGIVINTAENDTHKEAFQNRMKEKWIEVLYKIVVGVMLTFLISGCFNKEAIHPSDILQQSTGKGVVMFSTSTPSDRITFAKGIVIFRIEEGGKRDAVIGYDIDNPAESPDIQPDNIRLRWLSIEPGKYVIEMAATNRFECFIRAPELYFSVTAGDYAYLGDIHLEDDQLTMSNQLDRDAGFFASHANGGGSVSFKATPVEVKQIDYGCKNHGAQSIFVHVPGR